MKFWVKECAEDGYSDGHCMKIWALQLATWVSSSGKKYPITSVTPF